jgi:hypothetical protein
MEKTCKICGAKETTKWYSGPVCRKCHRKQLYLKPEVRERSRASCRRHYQANPGKCMELNKKWVANNYERNKELQSQYRQTHKKERRAWESTKRQHHFNSWLADSLRRRFNIALKKNCKVGSAVRDLGCSIDELKAYIQSKFLPGMTWDNRGLRGWHIDHIVPLSSAKTPQELIVLCHYSNLQPLWAYDNLSKGDRYPDQPLVTV